MAVDTCPKCGALITPQLSRCRQCKTYLHGTGVEGFIFENLLPQSLAASPGTGIIVVFIVLYYVLMGLVAGPIALIAMSNFNVDQLGGSSAAGIFLGQYWRFFTSMFGHHDLVHIAFNLYALTIVGPLVEQLFDRKKMMIAYFVTGVASMVISYLFHVELLGQVGAGSIGASGAVSGLMGATLFGAIRRGPEGRVIKGVMIRWSLYMVVFGLVMSGIDNAAHFGGFITGAALAYIMPMGPAKGVVAQKLLSLAMLGLIGCVAVSTGFMLRNAQGFPGSLERDAYGRRMMFFEVAEPSEWKYSSQVKAAQACSARARTGDTSPEAQYDCELAIRVLPSEAPALYRVLAHIIAKQGDDVRARKLRYTALRLERRL